MSSIMPEFENSHVRYLMRQIERLDERQREGRREICMDIQQAQQLYSELIGLHQRLTWMEKMQTYALDKLGFMPVKSSGGGE